MRRRIASLGLTRGWNFSLPTISAPKKRGRRQLFWLELFWADPIGRLILAQLGEDGHGL
jgi:hypothetical protein